MSPGQFQRPVGVVYLIDEITETRPNSNEGLSNEISEQGKTSKRGALLITPIAEDEAGDGVYFRPEDGSPVAEGQVRVFLANYRINFSYHVCSLNFFRNCCYLTYLSFSKLV